MKSTLPGSRAQFVALALMLTFAGYTVGTWSSGSSAQAPQAAPAPTHDYLLNAVLFMQTSAEFRALSYQAFNIAKQTLDRDLRRRTRDRRKRAVVVDIDETVLDNSPYQGWQILNNKDYVLETWYQWTGRAEAKAIPGAVDFLRYANSRGVRVFYVSNRDKTKELEPTMKNLRDLNFPDVSEQTVMLREKESSKQPRRDLISTRQRIVLLVGDNLSDLAKDFEVRDIPGRYLAVDHTRARFGADFIVLPNMMYGSWENALFPPGTPSDPAVRANIRRSALQAFTP
jgi:5'-nucleotidase (lipoprotein e(P4) family)